MMSNTTSTTTTAGARSKFPFTATQWQELEHQALIYKYMTAGIPVPPDLLFSIKRSLDSSLTSKLFPYPPSSLGWNPYQMGYGKKIDPEPGRCRRTDGKKWRCSKEAYPDSKYCERHMHRGKNRSRKPVENSALTSSVATTTVTMPTNSTAPINSSILTNQSLLTTTTPYNHTNNNTKNPSSLYSLSSDHSPYSSLYPHSTPSYNHKDFSRERYFQGMKEEVGEHAFFTENSGSSMRGFSTSSIEESWPLSSLDHSKQSSGYPNYLHNNATSKQQQQQAEKQCYIWGRDFNCELSMKVDQDERESNEKTTPHHFFDEWAPLKDGNGSGHGGGERKYSSWHDSSPSTTQLSISIPSSTSHHDFFLSNSRSHHHEG